MQRLLLYRKILVRSLSLVQFHKGFGEDWIQKVIHVVGKMFPNALMEPTSNSVITVKRRVT